MILYKHRTVPLSEKCNKNLQKKGDIMLEKLELLHTAMPYLSYAINLMNRILSVFASFLGIELPNVTTTASPSESESTTAAE